MIKEILTNNLFFSNEIISFLLAFFLGEESVTLLMCYFFLNDIESIKFLIIFFLGFFSADTLLFLLGRLNFSKDKIDKIRNPKIDEFLENNLFLSLLLTKFSYGLSMITIIYSGSDKSVSFKKFLIVDGILNFLLALSANILGYLCFKGFDYSNELNYLQILLAVIVIMVIISIVFKKWMKNKIRKKIEI